MELCTVVKGTSFLLQTAIGILGNLTILLSYAHIGYSDRKLLPVDVILTHLAFVNLMVVLTRGVPQTLVTFDVANLLNDAGCKIVIYAYRVVRALSVCETCLLSVFQGLTLMPVTSKLANYKRKAGRSIGPLAAALWALNIALCIAAPLFSVAVANSTVSNFTLDLGFCLVGFPDRVSYVVNGVFISTRDFLFVGLMTFASGYILLILHRHRRQVRAIQRAGSAQQAKAENRAAKSVISLVSLYVVFFGIDNLIWIYMLTVPLVPPDIADLRVFFSSCYASFSPLLIISSTKKIKSKLFRATPQIGPRPPSTEMSHVQQ
eukprot:gi/632953588/ref/XP_007892500.1/ PREDICTED: vomeronasal type-1 receptor 4-like [Callorhinchus milii]